MKSILSLCLFVVMITIALCLVVPSQGSAKWWDKFGEPKYGGIIKARVNNTSDLAFDPVSHPWNNGYGLFYFDCLFAHDWAVDRDVWPFITEYIPEKYHRGILAESWETPDGKTLVVTLRKGVRFHDKEPVNGRELVADDVVYHYDRLCGTGNGFTKPSPFHSNFTNLVDDINATDKYTVEFKFKNAGVANLAQIMSGGQAHYIEAPEVSKKYGDLNDWKNAVGTGPWIVKEYVDGSALRLIRNPDYWGTDERHPENRIPYAEEFTIVCIPDNTAALSALRTGKVDVIHGFDWRSAQTMAKSNPELLQAKIPASGLSVLFNLNVTPFGDIRIRKAMSMAIFINPSTVDDPVYNEMLRKITSTLDQELAAKLCREAEAYLLAHHWQVPAFPIYTYNIWRPELKGYSGELLGTQDYFARMWKE